MENTTKYSENMKSESKSFAVIASVIFILNIIFLVITLNGYLFKFCKLYEAIIINIVIFAFFSVEFYSFLYCQLYRLDLFDNFGQIKTMFKTKIFKYSEIKNVKYKNYNKISKYYLVELQMKDSKIILRTKDIDKVLDILKNNSSQAEN